MTARCARRSGRCMHAPSRRTGPMPTLIEWDNEIPPWDVLHAEARQADAVMAGRAGHAFAR